MKKNSILKPRFCLALTTVSTNLEARKFARALVQEKLAACVSLIPIKASFYFWKNRAQSGKEILLLIKTRQRLIPRLKKWILARHSYELPEFLTLSVEDGHQPYLRWILENTR